jgi:NifU-like protein involved in Fe-S cluster formation
MADQDMIKLYSGRILALAAAIPRTGRLDNPDASVKKRSPLCGSTVTVDLVVRDGVVADYAQDVKACALGQAAAAVVGAHVVGCSRDQLARARDQLRAMLKDEGPAPDAPFDDLSVLLPARDFKNRHASIMLTIEATVEAFDEATKSACA